MIKWQVLALNSLAGTPSTQASFIRKYFTYLLQAAPQSKLRTNFWVLLRMTMKNRTTFGSASQQCSAARQDFASWKLTRSRGRTARQHKSTSRELLLTNSTGTKATRRQRGAPSSARHQHRGPRGLSQRWTHSWTLLVPVPLEQVAGQGKRLRLLILPPVPSVSRNMLRRSPADAETPI